MLKCVARRLLDAVRGSDSVARLGGDEFFVLLSRTHSLDAVEQVARHLLAALCEPIPYPGQAPLSVGASIGLALVDASSGTAEDVLRRADAAMYEAKRAGKRQVRRA